MLTPLAEAVPTALLRIFPPQVHGFRATCPSPTCLNGRRTYQSLGRVRPERGPCVFISLPVFLTCVPEKTGNFEGAHDLQAYKNGQMSATQASFLFGTEVQKILNSLMLVQQCLHRSSLEKCKELASRPQRIQQLHFAGILFLLPSAIPRPALPQTYSRSLCPQAVPRAGVLGPTVMRPSSGLCGAFPLKEPSWRWLLCLESRYRALSL
jgi:hypothetical protein